MGLVLVCDTPSPYRDALERALEASGHRVKSANDAAALWPLVRGNETGRPDCVVMDETAVGGTGALYAAAVRLRGSAGIVGHSLHLLAVIARAEPEARAAALQVVDDVVSRPAHLVEILARIDSLLRGRGMVASAGNASERVLEDSTTGLRSRAFLDERIADEWRRATRYSEPLALLLVGVVGSDGAAITRGPILDTGLREAAGALRRALRQIDVLGRFSSAELAALLVNTHFAGALTCAERVRAEITPKQGSLPLEIVMGLSFYPAKDVTNATELVRISERALDRARAEGPGSICLIQHQGYLFKKER